MNEQTEHNGAAADIHARARQRDFPTRRGWRVSLSPPPNASSRFSFCGHGPFNETRLAARPPPSDNERHDELWLMYFDNGA